MTDVAYCFDKLLSALIDEENINGKDWTDLMDDVRILRSKYIKGMDST